MRVRWATTADARQIASIWHSAWHAAHGHLVPRQTLSLCTLQSFERRVGVSLLEHDPALHQRRPTALIADDGSTAAVDGMSVRGFAVIRGGAEVEQLYVQPDAQGHGIGSTLLAAAEKIMLEERHCTHAHLVVALRNQRAINFYKRNAWIPTERLPWMSTAPWEPVRPLELPVPAPFHREVDVRGGLTREEFAATRMRCTSMKKFLGYSGNPNAGDWSSSYLRRSR